MKVFYGILCLFCTILISGCCSNKAQKEQMTIQNNTPASIQDNRSLVEAEVIKVSRFSGDDYSIQAKVLSIEEDGAYPSIAVVGGNYEFSPGYVLDENGKMDHSSERNKLLKKISDLKEGEKFKAEVYLSSNKKWIIRSVIN